MKRKVRIVCYAVNGAGVGHLTRQVAIQRWVRRYCAVLGVRAEVTFLSSSEADGLLLRERFACFKLPSKTVVREAGLDKQAYLALAKQWVWHSLGLLRPDLFVVDTFPRGSFGELLSALDLCKRRAFVYRPLRASFAARADFQAMLPLYDAILVPDDPTEQVLVPGAARSKVVHTGPVAVRERVEVLAREEARARLGIPEGALAVYVTAGGGGDPTGPDVLERVIAALETEPDLHLVLGPGPLYRGIKRRAPGRTWLAGECAAELLPGFDLAISAAGYNSFFELMHLGLPAVFLPQEKIADEQARRAQRAVDAGAALLLPGGFCADDVRGAVAALRTPEVRARMAEAARGLAPTNNARVAAGELLRLILPEAAVEAAEEALDDALLEAARELGLGLEPFCEAMSALDPRPRAELSPEEAGELSALAVRLVRGITRRAIPFKPALRVAAPLARKLPLASPGERAAAIEQVLDAFLPFGDWAGAGMVVRTFRVERELTAAGLAEALGGFLAGLRRRDLDLYAGLAHLSAAQGEADELPSNRELLRAAAAEAAGAGA